jgi:hypothetical protein
VSGGTVTAWGGNSSGQINVPEGLSGVTAIAAGWNYSLALSGTPAGGFTLTNPTRTSGAFHVSLAPQNGVSYTLQFKNTLQDSTWTPGQTVTGNGGVLTLSDSSATGSQRFYGVLAQ